MAPSPDDRFSLLVSRGSSRGWVPEDDDLDDDLNDDDGGEPRTRPFPGRWAVWGIIALTVVGVIVFVLVSPASQSPGAEVADAADPTAGQSEPENASSEAAEVTVHVVGEVNRPGVVSLQSGARVSDAVDAAGGSTAQADTGAVNLARVLVDGEQIIVPARAESAAGNSAAAPAEEGGGSHGAGPAGPGQPPGPGQPAAPGQKVNINTADAEGLDVLPGVGPATANAIIEHRTNTGPFTNIEQLLDVPGIGEATLERLRDLVTV